MGDIDWQHLLFSFDGRINRAKFWAGFAASWVIALVVGGIIGGILYRSPADSVGSCGLPYMPV